MGVHGLQLCLSFLTLCTMCFSNPAHLKEGTKNKLRDVNWLGDAQERLNKHLKQTLPVGIAKNVILFIGDGMGINTITAARIFNAQQETKSLHESRLAWEDFPYTSFSATYGVDHMVPDSGQTATAMLTGVKTNGKMMGVDQRVRRGNCSTLTEEAKLKSILKYSHDEGKWTGVVTNTRITHATPGSAYANTPDRGWEADVDIPDSEKRCIDIAKQLVMENDFIRVIMGGGRMNFLTENDTDPEYPDQKGLRKDGANLMKAWETDKTDSKRVNKERVKIATNQTEFDAVEPSKTDYFLGLFEPDAMQFEVERTNEPSVTEMVTKAIKILQRSDKGYFLLVEGGKIDKAHHQNKAYKAMTETVSLSKAVQAAVDLTDEKDTLIVTTADHSQGFVFVGYTHPDEDIMGLSKRVVYGGKDEVETSLGKDNLPYLTLTYANGPGYIAHRTNGSLQGPLAVRKNVTQDAISGETRGKDYLQDAAWSRKSGTHAGEDVGVYARGPMSHLFHGAHEQNFIAHVMMYASCVGPNKGNCMSDASNTASFIVYNLPLSLFVISMSWFTALSCQFLK